MKNDHKTILAVFCALAGAATALFLISWSALLGVSGAKEIPAGSWLAGLLWDWGLGCTQLITTVCMTMFFAELLLLCREMTKTLMGDADWRPVAIVFAIGAVVWLPARGVMCDYHGALMLTLPAAFAFAGLGILIKSLEKGWDLFTAAMLLLVLACGGHRFVAMGLVAALATFNFYIAWRRQSIVKTQIALTLSVVATTVNIFFSFDFI